jgi:hypothetical protein
MIQDASIIRIAPIETACRLRECLTRSGCIIRESVLT